MKSTGKSNLSFFILSLATVIFLSFSYSFAQMVPGNLLKQNDVIILFDADMQPVAMKTASIYPAVKSELEKTIGWKVDFRPEILLVKDHETFQSMAGGPLIIGYALPDKNVIVIDYSRMINDSFALESTLKHELCHLLLHRYINAGNLPKWLDEGVAQWASGGIADIVMEKRSPLTSAVLQNRVFGLRYLADGFPADDEGLRLAYAESRSFVEYLSAEKGSQGLLALLERLRDGDNMDAAMDRAFSATFEGLEQKWHEGLARKDIWIAMLINNLTEIIFFLSALVVVYGFFRVWRRKRRYGEEDEYEERKD
jgi:hypothetical protein